VLGGPEVVRVVLNSSSSRTHRARHWAKALRCFLNVADRAGGPPVGAPGLNFGAGPRRAWWKAWPQARRASSTGTCRRSLAWRLGLTKGRPRIFRKVQRLRQVRYRPPVLRTQSIPPRSLPEKASHAFHSSRPYLTPHQRRVPSCVLLRLLLLRSSCCARRRCARACRCSDPSLCRLSLAVRHPLTHSIRHAHTSSRRRHAC
jgi:hypothetical protein